MRLFAALAILAMTALPASAQPPAPDVSRLVDADVMKEIDRWIDTEVVRLSIRAQNERLGDQTQAEIDALDAQWRAEREAEEKPLISATLSNPLSSYLIRMQAKSVGLYVEIIVVDNKGLNVGQSSITGDYWQGDEAKFQKTFPNGAGAIFIDEPEWDEGLGIWRAQVNRTIADTDGKTPIGAITVELNLTELQRRRMAAGS